jgi:hypothetical protein
MDVEGGRLVRGARKFRQVQILLQIRMQDARPDDRAKIRVDDRRIAGQFRGSTMGNPGTVG